MGCIVIGTEIFKCDDPDGTEGGLRQRLHSSLQFQQTLSRAGSIYGRSLTDNVGLFQSDYLMESLNDNIVFVQDVVAVRDLPQSVVSAMSLLSQADVSGGRFPSGGEVEPVSAIFDSNTLKGQCLYVPSTGHVDLALATTATLSLAVGFAEEAVVGGNTGNYITEGQVDVSDWTAIAGSTNLTPGVTYYLDPTTAGNITSTAPTTSGQYVVAVGKALTTKVLDVEIAQPILL